jgi:hypothetical protein
MSLQNVRTSWHVELAAVYWQFHVPRTLRERGRILVSFPVFKFSVNKREWSASHLGHFTSRDVVGG